MKKVLKYRLFGEAGLAGLLLLTLAGCHKDDMQTTLRVKRAGYQPQQVEKTYIGTGLQDMVVGWSSGDQVKINGTQCSLSNINVDYAEINVGSASSPYYAVYPYSSSNTASASGGSVTIPSSQTYTLSGGNQVIDAPMAAYMSASNGYIFFRNVASLLRVAVMNGNENSTFTVNSISVYDEDSSSNAVILCGSMQYSFNGETQTNDITTGNVTGYSKVVLDNCSTAGAISVGDMKVFNIVVPPYSTLKKLTFVVNGSLGSAAAKDYTITQNTARTLSHGEVAVQFFATNFDR